MRSTDLDKAAGSSPTIYRESHNKPLDIIGNNDSQSSVVSSMSELTTED